MKKIIALILFFFTIIVSAQDSYLKEMKKHRYEENLKFHNKKTSPLTTEGLKAFKSLDFYEVDPKYRVVAKLVKEKNPLMFEMPTTTERKVLYIKYGTLTFTIDGKEQRLALYQSKDFDRDPKYKDYLFLPFTDKTSGNGSYGGGRYVDVFITDEKSDGTIIVDFNKAYNPFCAYSDRYSCPITPKENRITIEMLSGAKTYNEKH